MELMNKKQHQVLAVAVVTMNSQNINIINMIMVMHTAVAVACLGASSKICALPLSRLHHVFRYPLMVVQQHLQLALQHHLPGRNHFG